MYSTCIFCHADLGKNESVEHFPIGRRLAFDAARGRLWVVCRKCERWNLTPLEERWEAIEDCERLFSSTKLRVSTDQIGLARMRDGLELVRIGQPQRPEMAAWRYGDQFGRRRTRHLIYGGALAAFGIGATVLHFAEAGAIGSAAWALFNVVNMGRAVSQSRVSAHVKLPGIEGDVGISAAEMATAVVTPVESGWGLRLPYRVQSRRTILDRNGKRSRLVGAQTQKTALLVGDDAMRVLATVLPTVNGAGASKKDVATAVDIVEESNSDRDALFDRWVEPDMGMFRGLQIGIKPEQKLSALPAPARLALEMMMHEDIERRALEGELSILESAWRDAEEIASISDRMLISDKVDDEFTALDERRDHPTSK